jgi:hypothetical protein
MLSLFRLDLDLDWSDQQLPFTCDAGAVKERKIWQWVRGRGCFFARCAAASAYVPAGSARRRSG